MEYIQLSFQENVALARLNRNVTNTINPHLLTELDETLEQVRNDKNIVGFVMTSTNDKFFSIGFDIPEIYKLTKNEFRSFFKKFNRLCLDLFTFPKPTIAAINGHAVAGGCILAICFDYRFIADGRKLMGINQIKLGVPLPYVCDQILRNLVGYRNARDLADSIDFQEPEQLIKMGLVDRIIHLDQLIEKSKKHVKQIGETSLKAFEMIKKNRTELVVQQIMTKIDEREKFFIDCWYSQETREKLKEAMEKFYEN